MGLNGWGESDCAFDFDSEIGDLINNLIRKELKDKANCYNTCGAVNIALLIEAGRLSMAQFDKENRTSLVKLIQERIAEVSEVGESNNEKNRKMHLKAYERMLKNINKKLKKFDYYDDEED